MIQLTPEERQALHDSLVDAFDRDGLFELVRFNLPYRLDALVDPQKALDAVVLDLMEAVDQRGELESLLRGAVRARPKNEPLVALCRTIAPQVFTPVDTRGLISQVTAGLEALTEMTAAPEVWAKVGESQAIFRAVMVETGVLAAYKSLHDGLHNLQMRLGAIEAAAVTFTTANSQARLLAQQAVYLRGDADRAAARAESVPTKSQEDDWIDELRDAASEIGLSLDAKDAARMARPSPCCGASSRNVTGSTGKWRHRPASCDWGS